MQPPKIWNTIGLRRHVQWGTRAKFGFGRACCCRFGASSHAATKTASVQPPGEGPRFPEHAMRLQEASYEALALPLVPSVGVPHSPGAADGHKLPRARQISPRQSVIPGRAMAGQSDAGGRDGRGGGRGVGTGQHKRTSACDADVGALHSGKTKGSRRKNASGAVSRARAASLHAFDFFGAFFHTLAFLHAREWRHWTAEATVNVEISFAAVDTCNGGRVGAQLLGGLTPRLTLPHTPYTVHPTFYH